MANGTSVEDWIGYQVKVHNLRPPKEPGTFSCKLEGVDQHGITVRYEKDGESIVRFLPWQSILYIQPPEKGSTTD